MIWFHNMTMRLIDKRNCYHILTKLIQKSLYKDEETLSSAIKSHNKPVMIIVINK
jgi:hypothetical protein